MVWLLVHTQVGLDMVHGMIASSYSGSVAWYLAWLPVHTNVGHVMVHTQVGQGIVASSFPARAWNGSYPDRARHGS
jgi:hypothetical protein